MDRVLDVANAVAPPETIKSQTGNAVVVNDRDALCVESHAPDPRTCAVQ
jgi:hypothetical protein